jgi:hypothetical protein
MYPSPVFRARAATLEFMGRSTAALRQQLLLWVGVVAVALSLLAMHQLSLNHTAASPLAVADAAGPGRSVADGHEHAGQHLAPGAEHPAEPVVEGTVSHDGCPGCAQHQAMMVTCLVALILLATGWLLRGPSAGRIVRVAPLVHRLILAVPRWRPPPRTWIELSVSRT